jgi:hypothetical protein
MPDSSGNSFGFEQNRIPTKNALRINQPIGIGKPMLVPFSADQA